VRIPIQDESAPEEKDLTAMTEIIVSHMVCNVAAGA
jgi:hypothetical protein